MFGIDAKEERHLGELVAIATVAWLGLAVVLGALVAILGPLGEWVRAVEREKRPTFEEEIEVRARRPVAVREPATPSPVEPATLWRPAAPARSFDEPPAPAARASRSPRP